MLTSLLSDLPLAAHAALAVEVDGSIVCDVGKTAPLVSHAASTRGAFCSMFRVLSPPASHAASAEGVSVL